MKTIKSLRFDILKNIHIFAYNSDQARLIEDFLRSINFLERISYVQFESNFESNFNDLNIYIPQFKNENDLNEIKKELYVLFLYIDYKKSKENTIKLLNKIGKILFIFLSSSLVKYATSSQKKDLFNLVEIFSYVVILMIYFNKKDFVFLLSFIEKYFEKNISPDDNYKIKMCFEKTDYDLINAYLFLINTFIFQFSIPENKLKLLTFRPQKLLKKIDDLKNEIDNLENNSILLSFYFLISLSFSLLKISRNSISFQVIDLFTEIIKNAKNKIEQIKNENFGG